MREEALTFDLVFLESEGYSEMVSVSGKGDTRGRRLQVLGGGGGGRGRETISQMYIVVKSQFYQNVLANNLGKDISTENLHYPNFQHKYFWFCNLNQQNNVHLLQTQGEK